MKYEDEKEILELLDVFDRDYFHVYKKMEDGKVTYWEVYYINLSGSNYFQNDNKPILKKGKSTKEDITKVLDEFIESKKEAKKNVLWDLFRQNHNFFSTNIVLSDSISVIETILGMVCVVLTVFCYFINRYAAIILLTNFIIITLGLIYLRERIKEEIRKLEYQEEEILIKNEMKYRKGNVYEFKKKNRKRTIKKNETKEGEV